MTRVLLVEDDSVIREAISGLLADDGYEVIVADDGDVALEILATERPDLILLDWHMTRVSGPAFLDARRNTPAETIPVIILSASVTGTAVAMREGLPVMRKPFDLDTLLALVAATAHRSAPASRPQLEEDLERLERAIPRVRGRAEESAIGAAIHATRNLLARIDLGEQLARRRSAPA